MTTDERDGFDAEDAPHVSVPAEDEWQAPAGADEDERQLTDEERAALLREQLKALRVIDVAHDMMLSLVTLGYQKLGLTDDTQELRNLEDARLAIELLRGVIDVLGVATGEPMVAPFRSTLAAMQLNFARVALPEPETGESERADEGPAAGAETAGSSADADGEPDASDPGA